MNILYINHYAGSPEMGMAFRPYYLAREWEKLGHKVRVVSATFSHARIKNPDISYDFEVQEIEGVQYQWVRTGTYTHNGVKRAITMFEFCFKLWNKAEKIVKDFRPDVVISSSTYTLDTYPAQKIAKLAQAKLIHENHDLWPLTLETTGGMSKYHPFCLLMGIGLRSAIKNSDHIVCLLPYAYEYFEKYGLTDLKRFTYIPNGIVKADWGHTCDLPKEHKELFCKLKEKFIIGYTGAHAIHYGLDILVESASQIKNENIAIVLVGKGPERDTLINKAISMQCDNVHFLPAVSKQQISEILKNMDAVYVGSKKTDLLKYGTSMNKIYDYMMASKPIIYGVDSKNKEVVDADCGIVVEPQNSGALSTAIVAMANISEKRLIEMGKNGKQWVLKNCEYEVLAKKFLDVMLKQSIKEGEN